jgi:hypothetical protein
MPDVIYERERRLKLWQEISRRYSTDFAMQRPNHRSGVFNEVQLPRL